MSTTQNHPSQSRRQRAEHPAGARGATTPRTPLSGGPRAAINRRGAEAAVRGLGRLARSARRR